MSLMHTVTPDIHANSKQERKEICANLLIFANFGIFLRAKNSCFTAPVSRHLADMTIHAFSSLLFHAFL